MVVCRVALLDGTTFEPQGIDKNSLGSVVFEKVTKHLDIIELDYFGLTYRDKSGKKFWLDHTKKISKQLKGGTWVFEFQVKFYPPDPQALKEDITRYQLCLQLRVDIFNGKLPCSFNTYALLGSYTVQSELGDHDPKDNGHGTDYLNDFDFAPTQTPELLEKIAELHKQHKGQTPTVAEAHFLDNAKKLAMYGVDMHDVKDSDNKDLSLGVCASGLLIYKDRLRINRFVWPKILKLSYKRNSFYIKIRPGEFEPHERTIGFKCDDHKMAKRLWKTCVEHHAFFRLKDADAPSSSTLFPRFNTRFRYSGRTALQAKQAAEQVEREEPHIARTAERRSMVGHDKSKSAENIRRKHGDENDMYDKKAGDPNATAGYGQDSMSDPYASAQYQGRPNGDDAVDRYDQKGTEGKHSHEMDDPALLEQLKEDFTQLLRETPDITSRSQLKDHTAQLKHDPRYKAVDSDDRRKEWFNEYVDKMLRDDFLRLLRETPSITSQSTWNEAKQEIDLDPRYQAVPTDAQREEWFNEYVNSLLKSEYMQLLRETPPIHSQSSWIAAREYIQYDPRFMAVPSEAQREAWFDEYIQNLKKEEFMQLLADTPDITSYSRYNDVKEDLSNDPRFHNVDTDAQREAYFNEYIQNLKKNGYRQLLQDTPDITANSKWSEAKLHIDTDPRYHAVDSDLLRAKWFNEYVNEMAGRGYYGGLGIGDYKSIDRRQEYLPIVPPTVTVRNDSRMPFFEPPGESDTDVSKRKPPPVAKKPRVPSGYDSEEDRLRTTDVPVTVETESYKYNPDSNDVPRSTSNIPIVETKTHKVTYEKDGIPYETEDTILISSQSVTTKTQTIDTTTYKTERDGVVETRTTTQITLTTDEDDEIDHDALLRAAIEEVTNMNPDISVEKIVCMRQIEEVNGDK